jgi:enoyl-CoA hydratase
MVNVDNVDVASESVLMESVGNVRVITLNRPEKLNAADLELQERLAAYIDTVAADQQARAVILTGAGRAFSAGGDRELLREIATGNPSLREAAGRVHIRTIRSMLSLSIPAIAAVNGLAVGYAAGLVSLCDLVVMGEDAFLSDPHVKFGIAANSATQMVWPRLTSYAMAKELLMSGRQVGATEALHLGLANRVCPTGKELATALELAELFTGLPPRGIAETKRAFNRSLLEEAAQLSVTGIAASSSR